MLKFLVQILANAVAVYAADIWVEGFTFNGGYVMLGATGFLLAFGAKIIRPIIKIIAFPLAILSMGLFNLLINAGIIWGVALLIPQMNIEGIMPLIWSTLLISAANIIFSIF